MVILYLLLSAAFSSGFRTGAIPGPWIMGTFSMNWAGSDQTLFSGEIHASMLSLDSWSYNAKLDSGGGSLPSRPCRFDALGDLQYTAGLELKTTGFVCQKYTATITGEVTMDCARASCLLINSRSSPTVLMEHRDHRTSPDSSRLLPLGSIQPISLFGSSTQNASTLVSILSR